MMTQRITLVAIVVCLAFVASCSHPPSITKETVAAVTAPVMVSDVYRLPAQRVFAVLEKSNLLPYGGFVPDSVVRAVAESLMVDTLTCEEARNFPLQDYRFEYRDYRSRLISLRAAAFYQKAVTEQVRIDSQAVLTFFEQHRSRFTVDEQSEVYQIQVSPTYLKKGPDSLKYADLSDQKVNEIAAAFADSLYGLLESGASFKKVAEQFSHDQRTRFLGGYVGWTKRGVYPPPFDSVAFGLTPGQFSKPYRDIDGYHIIMVSDHVDKGPLPISRADVFTNVKDIATQVAVGERGVAVLDSLSKSMKITFNPDVVDSTILTGIDSVWYAIVNDRDTIDVLSVKDPVEMAMRPKTPHILTEPEKIKAINYQINRALMAEAAEKMGLDTLPDNRTLEFQARINASRGILTRQWYGPDWKPTDSQIAAYYHTHLTDFVPPRPLKVQQIVAKDSLTAEFLRAQAGSGVDFLDLAAQYYPGDSAVRRQLADLGAIGPKDVDSAFFQAALVTAVGQISPPVKTKFGYHIIKVLARKDSKSLEDARVEIGQRLKQLHRIEQFGLTKQRIFRQYHVRYANQIGQVFLEPAAYRHKE